MRAPKRIVGLKNILRAMSDRFATDQLYQELRHFFRQRGDYDLTRILGKDVKEPGELPDTPRVRNLILNLILLRSLFQPKDVLHLLQGEKVDEVFKEALQIARVRAAATNFFLQGHGLLKAKIEKGAEFIWSADLAPSTLMADQAAQTPAEPAVMSAKIGIDQVADLYALRRLEEDERSPLKDSADDQARRALRLFELRCYQQAEIAAAAVLKDRPDHPLALYVRALLLLSVAGMESRQAGRHAFMAELNAGEGSGAVGDDFEQQAVQSQFEAMIHRAQALPLLVKAIAVWPNHGGYYDHDQSRRSAIQLSVRIAASRADVSRGVLDLSLCFEGVREGQVQALKDALLALLNAEEKNRDSSHGIDPMQSDMDFCWLDLYWCLDRECHAAFLKQWIDSLPEKSEEALKDICLSSRAMFHIRQFFPSAEERISLFNRLEEVCTSHVAGRWAQARSSARTSAMRDAYKSGDYRRALAIFDQDVDKDEPEEGYFDMEDTYTCVRILYDLSRQLLSKGDLSGAIAALEEIVRRFPDLMADFADCGGQYNVEDYEDGPEYADSFGNTEDVLFDYLGN